MTACGAARRWRMQTLPLQALQMPAPPSAGAADCNCRRPQELPTVSAADCRRGQLNEHARLTNDGLGGLFRQP